MSDPKRVPTLFEWIGGMPGVQKLFEGPGAVLGEDAPMPRWGWGEVKGPYSGGS